MTVEDKLNGISRMVNIYTYSAVAVAIIFAISLITLIVFAVKDKKKRVPSIIMWTAIVIFAILLGLGFRQKNQYSFYQNQTNYLFTKTGITPKISRKFKFNKFESIVKKFSQSDQELYKKTQK